MRLEEGFKGTSDFLDTLSEEDLKAYFHGGPVKAKIKQPKEVKKINLSQYFEPGKLVASMTRGKNSKGTS